MYSTTVQRSWNFVARIIIIIIIIIIKNEFD